jgi:ComF family protein
MPGLPTQNSLWYQGQQQILGLFLSSPCPLCQRSTARSLCPACQRQVRQCQLSQPLAQGQAGLTLISWGSYDGSLRQLIGRFKYSGHRGLAQWLGTELGQTWLQHQNRGSRQADRAIAMVPIPLHRTKLQQRGFNQAELLARWVSRMAQVTHVPEGLLRVQATQAQHSLNRRERQKNLAQTFQVNASQLSLLRQRTVWLVDDIFTTGATAQAAAQALRHQNIAVAGIVTVARTLSSHDDPASGTAGQEGVD